MSDITATLVRQLRDRMGAGMMDCKKALVESQGDMDQAMDWLRKKGLSKAAKKVGRSAKEGVIALRAGKGEGALLEVNSETDFVARNHTFQAFVRGVLECVEGSEVASLLEQPYETSTVQEALTKVVADISENIQIRRCQTLRVDQGCVAGYTHAALVPGLGKIGVLVSLVSSSDNTSALQEMGQKIAMHIAATSPRFVSTEEVPVDVLEHERTILREQVKGKPPEIVEKIVEGRLRKFYEEVVLLEQPFVMDDEKTVGALLEGLSKELGVPVTLGAFYRYALGETSA